MSISTIIKKTLLYEETLHDFLIHSKKDYLDSTAAQVDQLLENHSITTPFLRQLKIDFNPNVYGLKHQLLRQRDAIDDAEYNELFLEMLKNSDQIAKENDYTSYMQAMLELDNIDKDRLQKGMFQLLRMQETKRLKIQEKVSLTNESFFSSLHSIGKRPKHREKWDILNKLVKHFDYDNLQSNIYFEDLNPNNLSFTSINSEGKIIVKTPPINSHYDLNNFLYELSKALVLFYQQSESKKRFLRPGKILAFGRMVQIIINDIVCTRTERKIIEQITILENAYYATHTLFEIDLRNEQKNDNQLYKDIVGPIFTVDNDAIWGKALMNQHIQFSMHYRPIGYIMAHNIKTILKKERISKSKRARWLKENILRRIDEIGIDALI